MDSYYEPVHWLVFEVAVDEIGRVGLVALYQLAISGLCLTRASNQVHNHLQTEWMRFMTPGE